MLVLILIPERVPRKPPVHLAQPTQKIRPLKPSRAKNFPLHMGMESISLVFLDRSR